MSPPCTPLATIFEDEYRKAAARPEYSTLFAGVPVDPGAAVESDRSPDAARFFGADAGDFLTFHVDGALAVEAGPFGAQSVANLQTPAWWVSGTGRATPSRATEGWTVERK